MKERHYNNKPRTDTQTYDLLTRHSLEEVRKSHYKYGIYKAARILETNPAIIRYLALKNSWQRPLPSHLIKAHKLGRWNNMKTNFIPDNQL